MKKPTYRIVRMSGKWNRYKVQKYLFWGIWLDAIGDSLGGLDLEDCKSYIERIQITDEIKSSRAYVVETYYKESK